jgi:transposase-like protein
MVEFKTEILELYKQGVNITEIAKKICKENNLEYADTKRRQTSKIISKVKNKGVFD